MKLNYESITTMYYKTDVYSTEQDNTMSIRNALANTWDLDTIFDKFSFNVIGDIVYEQKALIVKNGILQLF